MRSTGFTRSIDDLGRLFIPKALYKKSIIGFYMAHNEADRTIALRPIDAGEQIIGDYTKLNDGSIHFKRNIREQFVLSRINAFEFYTENDILYLRGVFLDKAGTKLATIMTEVMCENYACFNNKQGKCMAEKINIGITTINSSSIPFCRIGSNPANMR